MTVAAVVNVGLCKIFFATITLTLAIFGFLINVCEPCLPVFIKRAFRYGKFATKEESSLVKRLEIPKSYFRHFYATSAIYYPFFLYQVISVYYWRNEVDNWFKNLLDLCCGYERTANVPAIRVLIAVGLLNLQILRRFYDTHFVSVFSKKATMNLSHYLIGMVYYPCLTLIILSEAPKFASSRTVMKNNVHFSDVGIIEILAVILFLWAWYHQHVTTVILANLRKNIQGVVVSQQYTLPEGDWFKYLSSPHSSAEIVMYSALTLLLWKNSGWMYVYAWVLTNQVETILLSHWWYQSHFKEFPVERKALIPFIY